MELTINFETERMNEIEYAIKEVAELVGDGYTNGMLDDGSTWSLETTEQNLEDRITKAFNNHGHFPTYANVRIEYKDDGSTLDAIIKLSVFGEDDEDDKIFFYCNASLWDLLSLCKDGTEDFKIIDFYSFTDHL